MLVDHNSEYNHGGSSVVGGDLSSYTLRSNAEVTGAFWAGSDVDDELHQPLVPDIAFAAGAEESASALAFRGAVFQTRADGNDGHRDVPLSK